MKKQKNNGSTLTELAILVTVVGILASIIFFALLLANKTLEERTSRKIQGNRAAVYNPTSATTVSNNSYIRLNLFGTPGQNFEAILNAIAAFEKATGKEVTSWSVDGTPSTDTRGIWVHHPPPKVLSPER